MLFSNCWREKSNRLKGQMLDYMQLNWQSSRYHVSRGQSSHKPCMKRAKFTQAMYQEGKVHTSHASRGQSSHKPCIKRTKFTQAMHQDGKFNNILTICNWQKLLTFVMTTTLVELQNKSCDFTIFAIYFQVHAYQ